MIDVVAHGSRGAARGDIEEVRRSSVTEVVALMGHELRNPLGSLRTALEVLEIDSSDEEVRRRMLSIVRRQVSQLSRLVEDFLDSSTSLADLVVRREPIDLVAVVRDLVESQRPVLEFAGLRLVALLPERAMPIEGDVLRLGQVLDNGNAAKFTPAGGEVKVSLERGEGEARLLVADDGDGIDGGDLSIVFEPFRRAGHRCRTSGLGLGLAIVRRLVEAHGGCVEARSDGRGCGAQFLVRLPLAGAPDGAGPTVRAPQS